MNKIHFPKSTTHAFRQWCNCNECMYAIGCLEDRQPGTDVPYYCLQYAEFSVEQGCHLMGAIGFPMYTIAKYHKTIPKLTPRYPMKALPKKSPECDNLIFGAQLGMSCRDQLFVLDMDRCLNRCQNCRYGSTCGEFCARDAVILTKLPEQHHIKKGETPCAIKL